MFQCIVYNSSHEPLSVVPVRRGLSLYLKGKVAILETRDDQDMKTVKQSFPMPVRVVLKEYCNVGKNYYGSAPLNQRNLFIRDGYRCQYCDRHVTEFFRNEYPTRDHVVPLSRGGKDEWTNIVMCCSTCNHRKDDRTPQEAELTLRRKPYAPTVSEIMVMRSQRLQRKHEKEEMVDVRV